MEVAMKDLRGFITECQKKLPKEFIRVSREIDPRMSWCVHT